MNLENPKKQKVKEPSQKIRRCGKDQFWIVHLLLNVPFLNLQSSVSYILFFFLNPQAFLHFHVILIVFKICTSCSCEIPWFLISEGCLLRCAWSLGLGLVGGCRLFLLRTLWRGCHLLTEFWGSRWPGVSQRPGSDLLTSWGSCLVFPGATCRTHWWWSLYVLTVLTIYCNMKLFSGKLCLLWLTAVPERRKYLLRFQRYWVSFVLCPFPLCRRWAYGGRGSDVTSVLSLALAVGLGPALPGFNPVFAFTWAEVENAVEPQSDW